MEQKRKRSIWINVYNAFAIKLIIDHYPVKSIKDIGPSLQIPLLILPGKKSFLVLAGKK